MIPNKDKEILRALASRYREISAGEENRKLRAEWVRFNDEKAGRPKVIVDEIPWQEMQCEELENRCESAFARSLETHFLRKLYSKKHFDTDLVLDDYIKLPVPVLGCDYGISAATESASAQSNRFCDLLEEEKDIEKICFQEVRVDRAEYERCAEIYEDIFGGVIPVRHTGRTVLFNAWDLLET